MISFARRWHGSIACVFLFPMLGCNLSPSQGVVKGTISVEGKPITRGLITFMSEVGNHDVFNAAIIDGKFETSPIPCGPTKIVIVPTTQPAPDPGGSDLLKRAPRVNSSMEVPAVYQTAESTPLTFKVEKGENTFDRDLKR